MASIGDEQQRDVVSVILRVQKSFRNMCVGQHESPPKWPDYPKEYNGMRREEKALWLRFQLSLVNGCSVVEFFCSTERLVGIQSRVHITHSSSAPNKTVMKQVVGLLIPTSMVDEKTRRASKDILSSIFEAKDQRFYLLGIPAFFNAGCQGCSQFGFLNPKKESCLDIAPSVLVVRGFKQLQEVRKNQELLIYYTSADQDTVWRCPICGRVIT